MNKGKWTKDDVRTLKKLFPHNATVIVAFALDRPVDCVKKKAERLGIRKTKKYMKTLGRTV